MARREHPARDWSGRAGATAPWPAAERAAFTESLLAWYRRHRRDLPWRARRSPYATFVSEVMLQQTQVATVVPYFRRFLRRFPGFTSLARAPQAELLRLWSGLGYYTRARNLQAAAQRVVTAHGGRLPRTAAALRDLPGVGPYTAAAVAAIAFGEPVFALDGNGVRVLARLSATRESPARAAVRDRLAALGQALMPPDAAGEFVQAVMELGSLLCTPRGPACDGCPVRGHCRARVRGLQGEIPRAAARVRARRVEVVCLVVRRGDRVLLQERATRGLLGGTWLPPLLPGDALPRAAPPGSAEATARALHRLGLRGDESARRPVGVRHVFSHLDVRARVVVTAGSERTRPAAWPPAPGSLACAGRYAFVRPAEVPLSTFARKLLAAAGPPRLYELGGSR